MVFRLLVFVLFISVVSAQSTYQVKAGDSLSAIARAYQVSLNDLITLNELANPDLLEVGQLLLIPSIVDLSSPLPSPFLSLEFEPKTTVQGEIQILTVTLETDGALELSYLGNVLPGIQKGTDYQFLLVTPVLQSAGPTNLHLSTYSGENKADLFYPITVQEGSYERENINLSGETSSLLAPEIVNREHALLNTTCSSFSPSRKWSGSFQYPIENPDFSSPFGTLRSYNNGPVSGYHRGLDFRGQTGTLVHATASGTVTLAETLELYGNTVIIDHGLGVCSAYMHLSEIDTDLGQEVTQGEIIGKVGATGLVTGPHLHFEIRVMGVPVSPQQWFHELRW
ncbi:MAG: M23 family metallopeptidase [Trueperaceae bacterium]|nr:M23 family metallopeptidase [Trueperaceae bacterium]